MSLDQLMKHVLFLTYFMFPLLGAKLSAAPYIHAVVLRLPSDQNGWQINQSGGGGADGGDVHMRIKLSGKSYDLAMRELQSLIRAALESSGYKCTGGGQEAPGGVLRAFWLSVETKDQLGRLSVSSAQVDDSTIVVAVASIQQAGAKP